MTHAKFHLNRLMLAFIFGIMASEPRAWRMTEKAGSDRVNLIRTAGGGGGAFLPFSRFFTNNVGSNKATYYNTYYNLVTFPKI